MQSALDGERMELPDMEPNRAIIPPAPYSIAPLGFDLSPPRSVTKKSTVGAATWGACAVFATVLVGTLLVAWQTARPPIQSVAAALAAHPQPPAPPPPVVNLTLPTPVLAVAPAAADGAGSETASTASGDPAKKARASAHHSISHKAKEAKVGGGLGSGFGSPSSDEAFMRAIRASSH
jgi:hypothetical protein